MTNKFDNLYSQNKSRSFVLHLVRAYLPINKVQKYWGNHDGESDQLKNEKIRCCCCGTPLASIEEIWSKTVATPGVMEDQMKYSIDAMLNPDAHKDDKREDVPIVKAINGKVQAFTGDKTETKMCLACVKELLEFTQNMILRGDKQINFAIRKEMAKEFPDALETINGIQQKQKEDYEARKKRKLEEQNKPKEVKTSGSTNAFGDFLSPEQKAKLGIK